LPFRFAQPSLLWLIIPTLIIGIGIGVRDLFRLRRVRCVVPISIRLRILKLSLLICSLLLIILSLARPQYGLKSGIVEVPSMELIIGLDVSASMSGEDVQPDRFSRAKEEAFSLLRRISGDRVGVILFAGRAFPICPVTEDLEAARLAVDSAHIDMVPAPGTRFTPLIEESISSFSPERDTPKCLVIISDGEAHEEIDEILKAARKARDEGIRIFCIGIGTVQGAVLPEKGVISKLNTRVLEGVSKATGGIWATTVEDIWPQIASIGRGRAKRRVIRYAERFQYAALPAFILLAVEVLL